MKREYEKLSSKQTLYTSIGKDKQWQIGFCFLKKVESTFFVETLCCQKEIEARKKKYSALRYY